MKRFSTLLSALALLAMLIPAVPAQAENENFRDVVKEFKKNFKTKNPLTARRKAVKGLSRSKDARGVRELLKVVKTQEKHSEKLRREWQAEEEAWQEKTARYEKAIKDRGNQVTPEEDAWLGATQNAPQPPKMMVEKNRIAGLYKQVLAEEDLLPYIYKSVSRLVNDLEGDEREKAVRDAAVAAKKAKKGQEGWAIHMLAYIKGDAATKALESFAKDTDPTIVILALEGIGRQNQERGIEILTRSLQDPRWQIRAAAIRGLSYYKDARVMDALIAAAKVEEGVLVRKYFAAMARIVQEQVPGTVEAWDSFWRENRDDYIQRWGRLPQGEPFEGELPDIPIDTSLGSTSFYGIQTNSKHIIFVVDVSGSMGEGGGKNEQGEYRIDVARKELTKAVQSLSATDEDERGAASFNIVLYDTVVEVYKPGKMVVATMRNKEKAFKWIEENVQPRAYTNIFDAIEQAFNVISDTKGSKNMKGGADTIFLMTDGFANRGKFFDPELMVSEVKEMNKTRKITIHTIGVGANHHRPFLSRLAAQNDGQYLAR